MRACRGGRHRGQKAMKQGLTGAKSWRSVLTGCRADEIRAISSRWSPTFRLSRTLSPVDSHGGLRATGKRINKPLFGGVLYSLCLETFASCNSWASGRSGVQSAKLGTLTRSSCAPIPTCDRFASKDRPRVPQKQSWRNSGADRTDASHLSPIRHRCRARLDKIPRLPRVATA